MTKMEQAARAIAKKNDGATAGWESYLEDARAAMETLREPSPAIKDAIFRITHANGRSMSEKDEMAIWQGAVDAILSEKS